MIKDKIREFLAKTDDIYLFTRDIFSGIYKIISGKHDYMTKMFVDQIYFFGSLSFPMTVIVSFFIGLVLTLQLIPELGKFGAQSMTGGLVMVSISREIAPVLTSVMIAGRMGSAMASELGSMNITDQIASLNLMGLSPVEYLVSPRILSSLIMLPFLTMISIFVSGVAGYLMAVFFYGLSWGTYLERIASMLKPMDVIGGIFKTIFFGFGISFVACYKGIFLKGRSSEVGRATTDSVAFGIITIIVLNLLFSFLIFS